MQKEIRRRVKLYGVGAILLATILVSVCYEFGFVPNTPTERNASLLSTFSSYEELRDFLKNRSQSYWTYPYYGYFERNLGPPSMLAMPGGISPYDVNSAPEHSTTNIQVAGVDEADVVKNDGQYIYVITGNNFSILKAYPPEEAQLLSTTTFSEMTPMGIFVNGNRSVVLGMKYETVEAPYFSSTFITIYPYYYFGNLTTYARVYDTSNKTAPKLLTTFTTSGGYFGSRMIGDYVYIVASQTAYYSVPILLNVTIDKVNLPWIESNGKTVEVAPTEVYYSNTSDTSFMFTTIAALNIQETAENATTKTIMLGGASDIYVSLTDIFITFPENGQTSIYRVHIENNTISPEAQGEVPGSVLNQFSMDQQGDYFRIATSSWTNWTSQSNVYVLNMNLSRVGTLEGLAPGQNFHSARFMGNKCYLVTFKKTDPLFVIDLSDANEPKVLGELHISGFSDYLHPYDEDHIIGVGKETVEAEEGDFAWYQGIKIALFDVSDVNNPVQEANYTIGERGSDSPVLTEHKAFLFDKSRDLLVIPVLVAEIGASPYPGEVGQPVWQGAYVFNLTLNGGFVFRGNFTHMEEGINILNSKYYVQRSLYIDNVLYTVSNAKVMLNSLQDLAFIDEISIS